MNAHRLNLLSEPFDLHKSVDHGEDVETVVCMTLNMEQNVMHRTFMVNMPLRLQLFNPGLISGIFFAYFFAVFGTAGDAISQTHACAVKWACDIFFFLHYNYQ